ncbi:MAG: hypothetical protein IT298_17335 [Chloroflexi bacterium]|nr:hypothetical protein [Chloroflexota bacterium]
MNILNETAALLSAALTTDPLLLLASAAATFDPFWNVEDEDEIEPDPLEVGLRVARGAFPDVYAEAVEQLRQGATFAELDRLICSAISAKGIPLDDLCMMSWGIPLYAYGAELTEPEFYAAHPDLLPILALFGVEVPDCVGEQVDVPERAYDIGRALALSLHAQDDPALRQVGWLLGWLFSVTGNSLVDCSDDALADIEPLSWSPEDIAFAVEMIEEADEIMADAMAGLQHLLVVPQLLAALERNVMLVQKKGKRDEHHSSLEWPRTQDGADRTAVTDAVVLQLRPDAA